MKFAGNQPMRNARARALLFSAVAALALYPALSPVLAADPDIEPPATTTLIGSAKTRFLALGIGKSVVIDLPREVKDVRSAQRA
jgi:pilus assembly protein CpaC